jgi:hypothetical protein
MLFVAASCRAVPTLPANARGQGCACLAVFGRALPHAAGPSCQFLVRPCRLLPDHSANTPRTCCRSLPGLAGLATALPRLTANERFGADSGPGLVSFPYRGATFGRSPSAKSAHSRRFFAVSHVREGPNDETMKRSRCRSELATLPRETNEPFAFGRGFVARRSAPAGKCPTNWSANCAGPGDASSDGSRAELPNEAPAATSRRRNCGTNPPAPPRPVPADARAERPPRARAAL